MGLSAIGEEFEEISEEDYLEDVMQNFEEMDVDDGEVAGNGEDEDEGLQLVEGVVLETMGIRTKFQVRQWLAWVSLVIKFEESIKGTTRADSSCRGGGAEKEFSCLFRSRCLIVIHC
ncbi:hypothetical protein POM88_054718 [Heracleum sosnowskyi]|uniref:Uncharacterized protein n=1 Tax=Heracleum sosnowskyi TaxID=360622 RepID=A0AAD8GMG9_9APIA|nr:hypothetical protein POM88_054718 [Heracleum sosnowskyi]